MSEECAVYMVEHPNHLCTVHLFSADRESDELQWVRNACTWSGRLGTIASLPSESGGEATFKGEGIAELVYRCSRPLIPVDDVDGSSYISFDHAKQLLAGGNSVYDLMLGQQKQGSSPPMYLR